MTHLQECGGGGARRRTQQSEPVSEAGMQGVAWYLEEREWNPGSRREGGPCSMRPAQLPVVPGLLEGICAERLEVSREGANR